MKKMTNTHTRDWYIVPYRHNFENLLIPRFFSYSCQWPAQAAVREESWNEKQFKIMAVWNNVSISSVYFPGGAEG